MSIDYCLLDRFPVEMFDIIFDYLSIGDILRGLLKISSYIDSVVLNYSFYQINFQSILKYEFDLICRYINPRKMISLILCDGIDTPGQSQLFLSLFRLDQFHLTLRYLSLIDINNQSMELITSHLDKFNRLLSLTIINSSLTPPSTLIGILPQLIRLNISSQWLFHNITMMTQLNHLIISNRCTFNQLESIIRHTPNLLSLNICLERENGENIPGINSNLTRLVLNMSLFRMNMIQMKQLLNCFPRLVHFEVECQSDLDLCDGHEWEIFLFDKFPRLKTFNFKFQLKPTIDLNIIGIQNMLRSYSTPYWLNEKHWFIGIEWNQRLIYSIPRFSCESADPHFRPPVYCTASDDSILYDHINALAVWEQTTRRFSNVKELWLVDNPLTMNLETMIDVNRVQRLIFVSSKTNLSIEILLDLINKMKNLNFIQFYDIPLSFNEHKQEIIIRQIHSIELMREFKSFSSIETLSKIFPQLERLHMKIKSNEDIQKVLHTFSGCPSIVRFDCNTLNIFLTKKSIEKILGHSNFTFAIDTNSVRLWIGSKEVSKDFVERRNVGCFSWCSSRKRLFRR